ncbi:cilia- and flagella-associated protein 36-like isoform X1 [Oncorhynchus keta]|uniref:cilia- and flagella-associated protein 36-like isoform X1 n=2 Tax=Oncorhynchus keta TaxID=8018 RepID=UPI0015FBB45E|nr:cilia- and flagella-associated protein 36-like isoform X1 [Oncorhynchus keta]XP_052354628.1 cilia- and flagella-associated protein 36-like isoform X1 [Oncorhynchus keta]
MAEDSEWVVESIAGYLGSPEWVIPYTDFLENKCTVFDDEDENKLTYTEIHQQYKHLVEKLLETYMQEVGIDEQQFLEACSSPFAKSKTLQTVFQPVLATDDFQMFRSLMVQKNMELQLQALQVIKERNGALPECLTDGADVMSELEQQEMKIIQEVLKRSKEDYDLEMARRLQSEEIGSTSRSCSDRPVLEAVSIQRPTSIQQTNKVNSTSPQRGELKAAGGSGQMSPANTSTSPPSKLASEPRVLPAVRVPVKGIELPAVSREKGSSQAVEGWIEEARKEAGISKPFTELSAEQQVQLQQRALYLRQQRDKLQAMKREQRPKPVTPEEPPAPTPSTPDYVPKMNRGGASSVQEEMVNASQSASSLVGGHKPKEISVEDKKKLQKRKHLAEKLKEEVIKK